ncbi:unnamed protein product [Periconia digitata]|uniref:L-lysine 2,3-aminomutase n=1 Tax=Periconia digitata TaxID=1303443 RepID=A0A9W4XVH6_9PLEO|nr:unnamed protein product [Periconia digitata]
MISSAACNAVYRGRSFSRPFSTFYGAQKYTYSTQTENQRYWTSIPAWKDVECKEFVSYRFQLRHTVNHAKLNKFLSDALPDTLAPSDNPQLQHIQTKQDFIEDATSGLEAAPMAVRLTPHILSRINWAAPLDDPIRRQFLPLRSSILEDHKSLTLDSLDEEADSPVPGLVHRYPGRALFLATSICPVYCRFCTRSYAVGAPTETVFKSPQKPSRKRWERVFQHIEKDHSLRDIIISGGDAYYLSAEDLHEIGERLLGIPHILRFRFASKGLAVAPGRILDQTDPWASTLIDLSNQGRRIGKQVCLHTHINHPNEITWITRSAANHLFANGVIVRNQSVLLKGVNDDVETMGNLIRSLSEINIQPYYVYQCDLHIRGTFSGFMLPSFVVDLPGGGGKRLASTFESYLDGISTWEAPGLPGEKGRKRYLYYDPIIPGGIDEFPRISDGESTG